MDAVHPRMGGTRPLVHKKSVPLGIKMRAFGLVVLGLLLCVAAGPVQARDCGSADPVWSDTTPSVNLAHVFCGQINRRGRAVGFHAMPDGEAPPTVRAISVLRPRDAQGVYEIAAEIGAGDTWRRKRRSSIFPDHCDREEVVASILFAARTSRRAGDKFAGLSGPVPAEPGHCYGATGAPLGVEGWFLPGDGTRINTAWPLHETAR